MTDSHTARGFDEMPIAPKSVNAAEPPPSGAPKHDGLGPLIFRNVLTLIAGQGLNLALAGAATILLARYLGTTQLGEFGGLYAYVGLYGWLTTFGLDTILARQVSQNRAQAGSILLTGVCLSSGLAVGATSIALVLAPAFGYSASLRPLLIFASVDVLLLTPLRMPGIVFQVDLRQWYGVGIGLMRQFVWLLALTLLASFHVGLLWIIVGRAGCGVLEVGLILSAIHSKNFLSGPWRVLPSEAKNYLSFGFPIAMSTLAIGIYQRIDQVMLHRMASDQVLGNYVASVRLTELVNLFPIAVMASVFPILAHSVRDEARFLPYLRLRFRSLMSIAFGVCVFVTLFSGLIVRLAFGAKFAPAAPLLAVLIWSEVPVFFGVVMSNALVAANLQNYLPLSTGVGAAVNIVLNIYTIPRWGAVGSAWATNISYTLAAILLFLLFRKTRSLAWLGFRILTPPCLLALFITAVLKMIPLPGFVSFFAALAMSGFGAWLLGIVRRSDLEQLARLITSNFGFLKTHAT